jgi:glucosamine-6-phosphate deaminase
MHILVAEDYDALSRMAASLLGEALRAQPHASLVLPTGNTPLGLYRELAALYKRSAFDTAQLCVFQLDEYLGVAPDDPRSFYGWIRHVVLDPLGISEEQVVRLRGDAPDPDTACREYDAAVRDAGGFDLVVLGLGGNGHLGFNEPPADPASPTRVVRLSAETLASNARYWGTEGRVPSCAITCGMANILAARRKLLLVSGVEKRDALRRALDGPVSPESPASYLQHSGHVTVIADAAAWPWPQRIGA